jgi:hypothetical protein
VEALGATIEAYVRCSREHSAYVRLMYRPELSETAIGTYGRDTCAGGGKLIIDTVIAAQRREVNTAAAVIARRVPRRSGLPKASVPTR